MKKTIEIAINGTSYPCSMTMGAMMRFKEVTGHEVPQFDSSVKDICAFIWSLVSSCAKRAGKKFDMEFWDFCDSVDPEEMSKCWEALQAQQAEAKEEPGEEKKSE